MSFQYLRLSPFAALKSDGSVVAWGSAGFGGHYSNAVARKLSSGVVKVISTKGPFILGTSFAALKSNSSVVAWGKPIDGGHLYEQTSKLNGEVADIFSTDHAFAALKSDGSVVTWGHRDFGGDSSSVNL